MGDGRNPSELRGAADLLRLKGATRLLIRDAGGVEAAGAMLGISHVSASRYQLAHDPNFMTIDKVAGLEGLEGVQPHITAALADLNGHVLIPKPHVPVNGLWGSLLGEMAKETGTAISAVGEALSDDGAISGNEIRRLHLRDRLREAMQAMTALDQALELQERDDTAHGRGGKA